VKGGDICVVWRVAARRKDAGHEQHGLLGGLGEGRKHLRHWGGHKRLPSRTETVIGSLGGSLGEGLE
jgi:hypothetical protein